MRRIMFASSMVVAAAIAAALVGCGGKDEPAGAVVKGNVAKYGAGGLTYLPARATDGMNPLGQAFLQAFVAPALADGLAGVTVSIEGTGFQAVTSPDGEFVFVDVPAGSYNLVFSFNGQTASYPLTVAANATIELSDVEIVGGTVVVHELTMEVPDTSGGSTTNGSGVDAEEPDDSQGDASALTLSVDGSGAVVVEQDGQEFVVALAAAGTYSLVFSDGTQTASYALTVTAPSTVEISEVRIANGVVSIGSLEVDADDDAGTEDPGDETEEARETDQSPDEE